MSTIKLQNVRLAFADLFNPDEKYGRFGASFPIQPGSANARAIEAAIDEVAKAKWGAKSAGVLATIRSKGDIAYQTAPKTNSSGDVYAGFEQMHCLNTSSKTRPTVVDRDRSPLTETDGRPYSGCYVVAIVELWAQDNSWGKRVNATLKGVQFFADGEAFSGGTPASAGDFEDLGAFDEAMA